MSIRLRLERLERAHPVWISLWDVICGACALEELDDLGQATLRGRLNDVGQARDTIEERIIDILNPTVPPPPDDER